MAVLALRIGLTPLAFALVARAQSRFGHWISGRLLGLPLTTGPFLLTVCLTGSRTTAAHAAAGVTGGQIAVVVFCCAYARSGRRVRPAMARVTSLAVALAAVTCLSAAAGRSAGEVAGMWACAITVWVTIVVALAWWPWPARALPAAPAGAASSLATRAVLSTLIVITTSTLVPILGARPAGILSSAPVLLSIMLPAAHRSSGAEAAAAMARGTIVSMVATVGFSAVLATELPHMAVLPALLLAGSALCCLAAITPMLDQPLARLAAVNQAAARGRAPARP